MSKNDIATFNATPKVQYKASITIFVIFLPPYICGKLPFKDKLKASGFGDR